MSLNPALEERRGSLPTGCPIRNLDDGAFEEFWGDPDPWALAIVDPDLKISLSWLFAEVITDTANKYQLRLLKSHFEWLAKSGSPEDVGRFLKDLKKCKENAAQPDKQLLTILGAKGFLEVQREWNAPTRGTAVSQAALRKECYESSPSLFPPPDDKDGWKSIMRRATKHGPIVRGKAGRPKRKRN